MDRGGVELSNLSLVGRGIQAILDPTQAVELARRANDHLAEGIARNPKRLKGIAALPLQEPNAAAEELTRCIKELGFCGALVNGFTQSRDADFILFYDMPQYRDFWPLSSSLMFLSIFILGPRLLHISLPIKGIHG